MSRHQGKRILICRPPRESEKLKMLLKKAGAEVIFFPTFKIEISPVGDVEIVLRILRDLPGFDWLIVSSGNGVDALRHYLSLTEVPGDVLSGLKIAVVGKKTAEKLRSTFPEVNIALRANHLQTLLGLIDQQSVDIRVRVLHPTSLQSIHTLHPRVPEKMELVRLPLYRTVIEDRYTPEQIAQLQSQPYDLILFSSPTSFDYFRKLWRNDDYLRNTTIATFGETTARHIRAHGFKVDVSPSAPEPEALLKAIETFFSTQSTHDNRTSRRERFSSI